MVAESGGTGFRAFKSNAPGAAGGSFQKVFHYFQFKQDEYQKHCHLRSNVESTFSMCKRKFADATAGQRRPNHQEQAADPSRRRLIPQALRRRPA